MLLILGTYFDPVVAGGGRGLEVVGVPIPELRQRVPILARAAASAAVVLHKNEFEGR